MAVTGSIVRNFHQGARSEYLAQYFLTAFGAVVLVPRPEDHGIDLFCTLGEPIGQRLSITKYYLVQVKSEWQDIEYKSSESVRWLTSFQYPFLVCVVDKKKSLIEVFATTHLCRLRGLSIENVTLHLNKKQNRSTNDDPISIEGESAFLNIGPPILSCRIDGVGIIDKAKQILESWLEIDERNIRWKNIGLDACVYPTQTVTNEVPTNGMTLKGNFKGHLNSDKTQDYFEVFLFLLANEIHLAVADSNKIRFEMLADTAGTIVESLHLKNSYGIRYLQIAINKGAEQVKSTRHLKLNVDGKPITTVGVKIIK